MINETEDQFVELNPVIGFYLLNFLDGTDASNFLEVVNETSQFWGIAPTSDRFFLKLTKTFCGRQRILVPKELYEYYLHECEVVDYKLVLSSGSASSSIQPIQRLFVHPFFSMEGFGKLCRAYRTPLFKFYSRLLPFNTDLYSADFGLIDFDLYCRTIGSERDLNDYEKTFFKGKKPKMSFSA
jgi:hypothetical protein